MKVLWLSATPSLFNQGTIGGWIASLESYIHEYANDVKLGIAFEYPEVVDFKVTNNGTDYYPVFVKESVINKFLNHSNANNRWDRLRPYLIRIVEDFKPDIIHCFGSEWLYGAITPDVSVPVVIHMQGFLNVINFTKNQVVSLKDRLLACHFNIRAIMKALYSRSYDNDCNLFEQNVMKLNHYFMGRTEWDRNIVQYYSPGSEYYCVQEAIRPEIYDTKKRWSYNSNKRITLITITHAGFVKGNEMVLHTAKILKDIVGIDFEWRVAGNKEAFKLFEKKTGIYCKNVNINLIGTIGPTQIIDELTEASLYIHPSIIDNSPNSLCEAQLVGCPVIATNVGGIPQLVEEGKTGFLYPYNEPHTLAFKICNLIKNEILLTDVSNREIVASHQRHNPQKVVDSVYTTYNTVIKNYESKVAN